MELQFVLVAQLLLVLPNLLKPDPQSNIQQWFNLAFQFEQAHSIQKSMCLTTVTQKDLRK